MKPFHSYKDGLPPGPGAFLTDDSKDAKGIALRIGDVVRDSAQEVQGLVIAIAGNLVVYLVNSPDGKGDMDWFMAANCDDVTIVRHIDNVLQEVARIESEAMT